MTRPTLLASLALILAAPLSAQDNRLKTLVFDENAVVRIDGMVKAQTTIKFAPDEMIENVAIGDSAAWQVQPNKAQTILFVKPLEPAARTNMTVVTDKRTYLFDLVASPRNSALYVLQFRYPELEKAAEEARLAANDTGPAGGVSRETRVVIDGRGNGAAAPLVPATGRTRGIGNRFRSASSGAPAPPPKTPPTETYQ